MEVWSSMHHNGTQQHVTNKTPKSLQRADWTQSAHFRRFIYLLVFAIGQRADVMTHTLMARLNIVDYLLPVAMIGLHGDAISQQISVLLLHEALCGYSWVALRVSHDPLVLETRDFIYLLSGRLKTTFIDFSLNKRKHNGALIKLLYIASKLISMMLNFFNKLTQVFIFINYSRKYAFSQETFTTTTWVNRLYLSKNSESTNIKTKKYKT